MKKINCLHVLALISAACCILLSSGCGGSSDPTAPTQPSVVTEYIPVVRAYLADPASSYQHVTRDLPVTDGIPTSESGQKLASMFDAIQTTRGGDLYPPERRVETSVYAEGSGEEIPILRFIDESYNDRSVWEAPKPGMYRVRIRRVVNDIVEVDQYVRLRVIDPQNPQEVVLRRFMNPDMDPALLSKDTDGSYLIGTGDILIPRVEASTRSRGIQTTFVFRNITYGGVFHPATINLSTGETGYIFSSYEKYTVEAYQEGAAVIKPATLVVADRG